jgi:hypothetical protein
VTDADLARVRARLTEMVLHIESRWRAPVGSIGGGSPHVWDGPKPRSLLVYILNLFGIRNRNQ